jgi:hypothetical protein
MLQRVGAPSFLLLPSFILLQPSPSPSSFLLPPSSFLLPPFSFNLPPTFLLPSSSFLFPPYSFLILPLSSSLSALPQTLTLLGSPFLPGIVADMTYDRHKICKERVLRYFGKPKDVSRVRNFLV